MADTRCWTKEFVIGFINIYKEHSCLWRVKSKQYTNKKLKKEAYDKLVEFCKRVFPEANRDFVTKKIQSLRGSFRKELKKVLESKRSCTSEDEVYIPSLWYFDLLLFTLDQNTPITSFSNMDLSGSAFHDYMEMKDDDESEEMDESTMDGLNHSVEEKHFPQFKFEQGEHLSGETIEGDIQMSQSMLPNKRKRTTTITDPSYDSYRDYDPPPIRKCDISEHEAVGINIAKKLQRMDPIQAIYAEYIINKVLRRGLLKTLQTQTNLCDDECGKR